METTGRPPPSVAYPGDSSVVRDQAIEPHGNFVERQAAVLPGVAQPSRARGIVRDHVHELPAGGQRVGGFDPPNAVGGNRKAEVDLRTGLRQARFAVDAGPINR